MEELSPGIEFYNHLESIVDSRQRLLGGKDAAVNASLLVEVFANHEKLVSWLWNHILDLQRDVASLQEESAAHNSRGTGERTPSPRGRDESHQNTCLVPETPETPETPCLKRKTRPADAEMNDASREQADSAMKDPTMDEEITGGEPEPLHAKEATSPIVSFSQRLLQRKKDEGGRAAVPVRNRRGDTDSENSIDAATQPPTPNNGYPKLPLDDDIIQVSKAQSAERPQKFLPGSAVTPFRTEKKTESDPATARQSKGVAPTPATRPVSAPVRSSSVKGRLRKKQRRKRPRLQLEELAPEKVPMFGVEENNDVSTDRKGTGHLPRASNPSRVAGGAGNDSRRKRLSFASAASPAADKDSLAQFHPRRRRSSNTETVAEALPVASGEKAAEVGRGTSAAGPSRRHSAGGRPSTASPRFDGFKTPAAVDRATRAAQEILRRKEDCAANEVVRGHARKGLIGYSCHECEPFLREQAAQHENPEAEFKRLSEKFCKHRARQPPPGTPPGFWKLTFDETQTQPPKGHGNIARR